MSRRKRRKQAEAAQAFKRFLERDRLDADERAKAEEARLRARARSLGLAPINRDKLHSRSVMPSFPIPTLGGLYYLDWPFTCRDCGSEEVWTGRQQKWWFEVAGGEMEQIAIRCRNCRRKERRRREEARRVHLEGLERKRADRERNRPPGG